MVIKAGSSIKHKNNQPLLQKNKHFYISSNLFYFALTTANTYCAIISKYWKKKKQKNWQKKKVEIRTIKRAHRKERFNIQTIKSRNTDVKTIKRKEKKRNRQKCSKQMRRSQREIVEREFESLEAPPKKKTLNRLLTLSF
jgi:hypothetical protein